VSLLTTRARVRKRVSLHFRLSKISHVGVVVLRGSKTVFATSASFAHGTRSISVPALRREGTYTIHLAATDLARNFNRDVGSLQVAR
jgi:hypothetical protein